MSPLFLRPCGSWLHNHPITEVRHIEEERRDQIKHFPTCRPKRRPGRTIRSSLPPIMAFRLLDLPYELRHKIYLDVFQGSALIIGHHDGAIECDRCGTIMPEKYSCSPPHGHSLLPAPLVRHNSGCSKGISYLRLTGPSTWRVLQTCKTVSIEALPVLASSLTVYCETITERMYEEMTQACATDKFLGLAISRARHVYFLAQGDEYEPQCAQLFTGAKFITVNVGSTLDFSDSTLERVQSSQGNEEIVKHSRYRLRRLGLVPLQRMCMVRREYDPDNAFELYCEGMLMFSAPDVSGYVSSSQRKLQLGWH